MLTVKDFTTLQAYEPIWEAMKCYTETRDDASDDQIWFLEHHRVFTQGQAGKPEHLLNPGDIPVVQTDRGGQVTYHGPGQLMAYVLFDLRRAGSGPRELVTALEEAVIATLKHVGLEAVARCDARGVYVNGEKICSIGLRVKRGCSYHGLSLNVKMDLEPFSRINPCGYSNLSLTDLNRLGVAADVPSVKPILLAALNDHLPLAVGNCA